MALDPWPVCQKQRFDYFLLFFYSQVMGVSASLVSAALAIALVFDAISDPLIGFFSDNTRTLGASSSLHVWRGSAGNTLLFSVVESAWSALRDELFLPLSRYPFWCTLITVYGIPSSALVAEITDDYDERTSLLSYRIFSVGQVAVRHRGDVSIIGTYR